MYLGLDRLLLALERRIHALSNERGASAVEYGLLVALIAVIIIGAVGALGVNLNGIFQAIVNALPG